MRATEPRHVLVTLHCACGLTVSALSRAVATEHHEAHRIHAWRNGSEYGDHLIETATVNPAPVHHGNRQHD